MDKARRKVDSPAQTRAVDFLRRGIYAGDFAPGRVLPSVARIAAAAEVSLVTAWKAVNALKAEGLLAGRRGGRPVVAACAASVPGHALTSDAATTAWDRIRQRLKRDLLSGVYQDGSVLPSIKELQYRFSASYRTMSKVLTSLCDEGVLVSRGRGYEVPSAGTAVSSGRVVLLVPHHAELDSVILFKGDNEEYVWTFERECARHQVKLDIVAVSIGEGECSYHRPFQRRPYLWEDPDSILGCVYHVQVRGMDHEPYLLRMHDLKKPAAVIDLIGGIDVPARTTARFRIFSSATSPRAAESVGRHLLAQGHTAVAFISPFHKSVWSRNRLAGLRSVFAAAGLREAARAFTVDQFEASDDFRRQAERRPGVPHREDLMAQWKNAPPAFRQVASTVFVNGMRDTLSMGETCHESLPLFRAALRDTGITAWVCVNDEVAHHAVAFLKAQKVDVPHKLSLVSFDDSLLALQDRITSYDTNMRGVAEASLGFVLHPERFARLSGAMTVEIDGYVVERGSVARPLR